MTAEKDVMKMKMKADCTDAKSRQCTLFKSGHLKDESESTGAKNGLTIRSSVLYNTHGSI